MWNNPKPAQGYQLGWKDKKAASRSPKQILSRNFERIIVSNGDLMEEDVRVSALQAWQKPLESSSDA